MLPTLVPLPQRAIREPGRPGRKSIPGKAVDLVGAQPVAEAPHRLVETYLQLGVVDEARQVAAVLRYNYPGSNWYEFSYDLLEDVGVLEPGARPKAAFLRKSRTAEDDQDDEEKLKRAIDLDGVTGPNIDESDIGNNAPVPTDNPLPR